ncbi:MAG: thioredoxin [Dehalococcoidia bacterium]|nr:thioredoxin [Dehalococcoidia bacterium]
MTKLHEISDSEFRSVVLNSDIPVLVDFSSSWCPPCFAIAPALNDLAGDYEGKIKFTSLNVDSNPRATADYGISSVPTVLIFKKGEQFGRVVGAVPKSVFKQRLEEAIVS